MILNDIWSQFNRLIKSSNTTDVDLKINALNMAQVYLVKRVYQLGKKIDEFISQPTNVANLANVNYVSCPADFLALHTAWYKSGTSFIPFGRYSILTYDDFLQRIGQNFFDTTQTGTASLITVKEPYIYFDQYFSAIGTDLIKISYIKSPTDVVYYDTINLTGISGTFGANNVVFGNTSNASATIYSVGASHIKITSRDGTFVAGEVIEDQTSLATGTMSGDLVALSFPVEFTLKWKTLLTETWALMWEHMKGQTGVSARSDIVDGMIEMLSVVNRGESESTWSVS